MLHASSHLEMDKTGPKNTLFHSCANYLPTTIGISLNG